MYEGLLPIGTVVMLKDSTKRLMVIGVCQKQTDAETETIWDYAGCVYPEGYISGDMVFLFNADSIDEVYALGFQDEEQLEFKSKAENVLFELRKLDE